jgi:hypothetical protein
VVTEVSKLKQELDREIVVPASYQLGDRAARIGDLVDGPLRVLLVSLRLPHRDKPGLEAPCP